MGTDKGGTKLARKNRNENVEMDDGNKARIEKIRNKSNKSKGRQTRVRN